MLLSGICSQALLPFLYIIAKDFSTSGCFCYSSNKIFHGLARCFEDCLQFYQFFRWFYTCFTWIFAHFFQPAGIRFPFLPKEQEFYGCQSAQVFIKASLHIIIKLVIFLILLYDSQLNHFNDI